MLDDEYTAPTSADGFISSVWGPTMWCMIHSMSFAYPVKPQEADKRAARTFLEGLRHVLPCRACRTNFTTNMTQAKYDAERVFVSRDTLSHFCWVLHTEVSRMLGKTVFPSFVEITHLYTQTLPARAWDMCVFNPTTTVRSDDALTLFCSPEQLLLRQTLPPPTTRVHATERSPDPHWWGPAWWFVLHVISLNFPLGPTGNPAAAPAETATIERYGRWFETIAHLLPSLQSRPEFVGHLQQLAYCRHCVFTSRTTAMVFFHGLHNVVNDTTVPLRILEEYEAFRANQCRRSAPGREASCIGPVAMSCRLLPRRCPVTRATIHHL